MVDAAVLHAAIRKLAAHDLDCFLEERRLYRELVASCQHKGVPEPRRPRRYADMLERARNVPTHEPTGRRSKALRGPMAVSRIVRPAGEVLHVH